MHKLTISVKQEKRKVAKFLHEFFFFILLKNFVREARAKLVDKKNTSVDDEITYFGIRHSCNNWQKTIGVGISNSVEGLEVM